MTPLSLYIHWPFCLSKCPYCDFNSHVAETIDHPHWRSALVAELEHFAASLDGPRRLETIFFGGGTPSLMDPATVAALLERAAGLFSLAPSAEITLEANPGAVDTARLADFRAAGVNRISLGVQSLREDSLRFLERRHDAGEALAALRAVARLYPRFSFDLIYARPGQTARDWETELAEALALLADLGGDHLSLYQLTIEKGTRFFRDHRQGAFHLPEEDEASHLYTLTQALTEAAGLPAYEISNHARPGGESRHNLVYWRGGDYIGIGPGAHGRLTRSGSLHATRQHSAPARWLEQVAQQGHGTAETLALSPHDHAEERVMMGLRLSEGLDPVQFHAQTGLRLDDLLNSKALELLRQEGLLSPTPPLKTTPRGRLLLNALLAELLAAS